MLPKRLMTLSLILLLVLVQFYHCEGSSPDGPSGEESAEMAIPVNGPIQSIILVLRYVMVLLNELIDLINEDISGILKVVINYLGKILDTLMSGLMSIPSSMIDFLARSPDFLGGGIFKAASERMDTCELSTPFSFDSDTLNYIGGCLTTNLEGILDSVNEMFETLMKVLTVLGGGLGELQKKPLKEMPSYLLTMMTAELKQVPSLLGSLTNPTLALVKVMPLTLWCILKSIPPSLKRITVITYDKFRCLFGKDADTAKYIQRADEAKVEAQEALFNGTNS